MSFQSPWFLAALPVLFLLYYTLPKKAQWPLLLLASLGFYAMAGLWGLLFVVVSVASSYLVALRIDQLKRRQKACVAQHRDNMTRNARKAYNARQKRRQRWWLIAGMALNFGLLAATKIWAMPWVVNRLGMNLLVPIGISFYTFRIMGYLIDVFWDKTTAQRNPFKLALFTIFFPYVWQGPISRYAHVSESLLSPKNFNWANFERGLQRMIWGYFKKMVIADRLMISAGYLVQNPGEYSGMFALWAMVVWSAALYADFTGGIDITIGIAQCLGVKVEENFLSPFRAKDIFDYWRRWHITMGTWFRDYVFYPISVARPMRKCPTRLKIHIATLITWFTTGIWHGVAWNFIAWGLANGVVIMISQELIPFYKRFHKRFPKLRGATPRQELQQTNANSKPTTLHRLYGVFEIARTFFLLTLIRSFDIYLNVPLTLRHIGSIFVRPQFGAFLRYFGEHSDWFGLSRLDWLVAALAIALLVAAPWFRRPHASAPERKRPHALFWAALVLAIFVFGIYGLNFDMTDFFYTQF